jgi:hypothetical protein
LIDYKKKGVEELDLFKDDMLRVVKRYNHWSYVRHFLCHPCKVFTVLFVVGRKGGW